MAAAVFVWAVRAAAAPAVTIHEVMWDGTEYVELFNTQSESVSLTSWRLVRQQTGGEEKTIVQFADGDEIAGGGYFLVEKAEEATTVAADRLASGLTLVNTGERLTLYDAAGAAADQANQLGPWFAGQNTTDGVAMERIAGSDGSREDNWYDSTGSGGGRFGTPGQANSQPDTNTAPQAAAGPDVQGLVAQVIAFSADDSTDADGDTLTYVWSFGDGTTSAGANVTHAYASAGTYTAILNVSDGELDSEDSVTVSVAAPTYSDDVIINEFLPDPDGADSDGEFIELKNLGSGAEDISGWRLDDADGGSSPHTIPAATVITAGGISLFERSNTGLALNNEGDTVRLLTPSGSVAASFTYTSSDEGQSYNRSGSGSYMMSTTVTPGTENVITASEEDEAEEADEEASDEEEASGDEAYVRVALKDVRSEDKGTLIRTDGVVSVPPGIFGDTILYLAGSGIQVYFTKEEWPELKLGDTVTVQGELTTSLGEYRLKLAAADDIEQVAAGEPPAPHAVKTGAVDQDVEGTLVTVQGTVSRTSGDTFYVDDGSGEVKVFIKKATSIEKPKMSKGMAVTITGVVSRTTAGYRILPRFQEDVRLGLVAGLTSFPATGEGRTAVLLGMVGLSCYLLRSAALAHERLLLHY